MKTLYITVKNVYGKEAIYPACQDADLFCQLLGTKTLTQDAIHYIKQLGWEIEVVNALRAA